MRAFNVVQSFLMHPNQAISSNKRSTHKITKAIQQAKTDLQWSSPCKPI